MTIREELELKLNKEFYNDLIELDYLNELVNILESPSVIKIDIDDVITLSKGKLVGVLSEEYINTNQRFNYKLINNEKPNSCLIYITSNNSG